MSALRIVFVGGGSGGHLFPAIAVAHELLRQDPECCFMFLTSHREIDQTVLESSQLPPSQVRVQPYADIWSRQSWIRLAAGLPSIWRSLREARRSLRSFQPNLVIGLGAMASVPGIIAADKIGIPIVLLEQNCLPGKATRLLARRAQLTIFGWPVSADLTRHWPSEFTTCGTPVRASIRDLTDAANKHDGSASRRILILGGSQGAHSVNRVASAALCGAMKIPSDWEVVHQAGIADAASIREQYRERGVPVRVESFLTEMDDELRAARLVISRAGAVTLQELACAGVPCILIPLSTSADSHQWQNARFLEQSGAAIVIDERQAMPEVNCRAAIDRLMHDEDLRIRMSRAINSYSRPQSAKETALLLTQIALNGKKRSSVWKAPNAASES